jgi:hypothetical protein
MQREQAAAVHQVGQLPTQLLELAQSSALLPIVSPMSPQLAACALEACRQLSMQLERCNPAIYLQATKAFLTL